MISIIIPTYNEASAISASLQTIFDQTYKDFEIILVNDGSTDTTDMVVAPYRDRIRYYNRPHCGRQATRNFGVSVSRGEYLFVCDCDIRMRNDCLEKMHTALATHHSASFAYSAFHLGWKTFKSFPFDPARLRNMNYINIASLMRREHFSGFDESIGRLQDWDMWLSMVERGFQGVFIPEVLFTIGQSRLGLSRWLPKMFYHIPWQRIGIRIKTIEDYEYWKKVIQKKHGILA